MSNMDWEYICNSKTFIFKHKTIALPVQVNGLPDNVSVKGKKLLVKSNFHVTLIPLWKIQEKRKTKNNFEVDAIGYFCSTFGKNQEPEFTFKNQFYFVTEAERQTLIVRCEVANFESFFNDFSRKFNLHFSYPPLHVTLYTRQLDAGIFVTDNEDLENLAKPLKSKLTDQIYQILQT